jgi:sulfur dioxygenase
MIFRQFCAPDKQLSYLLADPVTRQAVLLDPHFQLEEEYLAVIAHLDLEPAVVIDSHAHESHPSAAQMLCGETGATWITSSRMDTSGIAQVVAHGDVVVLGEEQLDVMETPGHSPCSLCLRWRDRVFTGHTLLAGRAGPCNRPDSNARQLFESIRKRLYVLPASVRVFPGFQYLAAESTIGYECRHNEELKSDTQLEEFLARKLLEQDVLPNSWDLQAAPDADSLGRLR